MNAAKQRMAFVTLLLRHVQYLPMTNQQALKTSLESELDISHLAYNVSLLFFVFSIVCCDQLVHHKKLQIDLFLSSITHTDLTWPDLKTT